MSEDLEQALKAAEKRALEARNDARQVSQLNAKLQETLRLARERLALAQRKLAAMQEPPLTCATVLGIVGDTLDVEVGGRRLRIAADPTLQTSTMAVGRTVLVNESMVAVDVGPDELGGSLAIVREMLPDSKKIIVAGANGEDRVVAVAPTLAKTGLRHGDTVALDRRGVLAVARVPRQDVEDLILEEVPEMDYSAIGGLSRQIDQVRDAVELPFLHQEVFSAYTLSPPKGILLYGPPGCGKTMIAKAVAHSLATTLAQRSGGAAKSYFLNIKGPELLNKYVGETERQIRVIFQRARERASAGMPVIVFFDEMDSLFRTRGSGVSSDVENTIVPQLLSEIDGVEGLANVIIIGATNREDMIDPAILRPGRLDVKIKLERPDADGSRDIFAKYLTDAVPLHPDEARPGEDAAQTRRRLIDVTVEFLFDTTTENEFLEVTYAGGDKEVLYFKDFASGAMIANIVDRAKKYAIKRELGGDARGVRQDDLLQACRAEFAENEDLPNTTNPEDWARISGKKGERIVYMRTLVGANSASGRTLQA